jgi:hypothetical protein
MYCNKNFTENDSIINQIQLAENPNTFTNLKERFSNSTRIKFCKFQKIVLNNCFKCRWITISQNPKIYSKIDKSLQKSIEFELFLEFWPITKKRKETIFRSIIQMDEFRQNRFHIRSKSSV